MIVHDPPHRIDKIGTQMSEMVFVQGPEKVPLDELLVFLVNAGVSYWPMVMVHSATLRWERPATDEEKQEWQEHLVRDQERREKWEREYYEQLKEKYG